MLGKVIYGRQKIFFFLLFIVASEIRVGNNPDPGKTSRFLNDVAL
jgi:hypothetical protein